MNPIIGITTFVDSKGKYSYCCISQSFIQSILLAGGIPILIPIIQSEESADQYLDIIHGLLFTGGSDISPLYYGENPIKEIDNTSRYRDEQEISMCKKALKMRIPILGVCRGMQVINVALGGTLYQDIYNQIEGAFGHNPKTILRDELYHSVKINKESKLFNLFMEETILVNSSHHQAVREVGDGVEATAFSSDGVVEGMESKIDQFIIGVQWHPEDLVVKYPKFLNLFKSLVDECKIKK